jgi:hypothetical protein
MRKFLVWFIPRQPRHAIEVCVLAGELRQTVLAHGRDDQGVASEKLEVFAEG